MTKKPPKAWRNFTDLNNARGLVLMALGAVTGLIIAAISLFSAEGTTTFYVPPEYVALVNQKPISRSDFLAQIRALYDVDYDQATSEQRQQVLDDMIREELFVQRGTELDVAATDIPTREAMVSAAEGYAIVDAMTEVPSDDGLLEYYNNNKARYSSEGYMQLRDVVFDASTAPDVLSAARAVSPDEAITRFGGMDSGKVTAEDEFYFAADIHLGTELADVAKALADGAVSSPVALSDGTHIIYMTKNVTPVAPEFEQVKARTLTDYRRDHSQRLLERERKFLRNRANILIAGDIQ